MIKTLFKDQFVKYIAYFFLFITILNIAIYFLTHFNKKITVKNKYIRYRRKGSAYHIVDTNGDIYQVGNVWFKGDFNRAEDYNEIELGKTYNVKGYGFRLGILDMYKTIYRIL